MATGKTKRALEAEANEELALSVSRREALFTPASSKEARVYGKKLEKVLKLRFVDGLTYDEIARVMGIEHTAIERMCKPFKQIMDDPARVKAFKVQEANILDGVRMLMVEGMVDQLTDPVRRKKMDLSRLTWGYSTLYDKARLERGESTANIRNLSDLIRAAEAKDVSDIVEAEVLHEGNESEGNP
jgi:hypothetical protein